MTKYEIEEGCQMDMYTIRDMGGSVVATGYEAEDEDEALEMFLDDHPNYEADDFYASIANWND